MKKLTLTLALVLCLVLCAFAFASCGKEKAASTTAAKATAGNTECAHVWGEYVYDLEPTCSDLGMKSKYCTICGAQDPASVEEVEMLPHTEAENYTVDTKPTCSAVGYESKHCSVCGQPIASTVRQIEIDDKAHDVDDWTVTAQATMFNPTGSRTGTCKLCKKPVVEELKYEPAVLVCDGSRTGQYDSGKVELKDVRGDKHFYDGNDLYVEYSILWNPTMLNLDGAKDPYIVTRFPEGLPILYWSPVTGCPTSDCKVYPGAFEWMGDFSVPITDGEVATPEKMCGKTGTYEDYPNLGGATPADAENLDNGHEWGWHRVALRFHMELADEAAVKAGTAGDKTGDYVGTVTCYIDGVAVFKLQTEADEGLRSMGCNLFTAESDGADGITYSDVDGWVVPFELHKTGVKSGTKAYVVIADVMVTCGNDFAMKVEKVATPEAAKFVVDETNNVEIDAPVYFKLAE